MKGLIRALLAAVGVLGILVVVAVVYITTFFDPNDLKPRLVQAVREQSGLELRLDGPLSWSFYPRIGVSVEDAEAWLPEQSRDDEPFVGFDRAEVSVAFAPLLTGDVAVDGLILDGMRLSLVRGADGRGNWQVLLDRLAENDAEGDTADAPRPATAGPGLSSSEDKPVAFDVASVKVENSRVHYVDLRDVDLGGATDGETDSARALDVTLDDLSLTGTNVSPRAPFPVQLAFDVSGVAPRLEGHVQSKARMSMDLAAERYTFENVTLDGNARLPEVAEAPQTLSLKIANLLADTRNRQYRADGVQLDAGLSLSQLEESPLSLTLKLDAETDLEAQTARLANVALTGDDGLDLTGSATFIDLGDEPTYDGRMALAPLALRDWLIRFGLDVDTADAEALTALAANANFRGDLSRVDFEDLDLTLDDTAFEGALGARFDGRALQFDLAGDRLDLDAYLDPDGAVPAAATQDQPTETAWLGALGVAPVMAAAEQVELLPVAWLAELRQQGRLTLEALKLKGAMLNDVTLETSGSDGRQRIDTLEASLYGGTLEAASALNLRRTPIEWSFTQRLAGSEVAPLVEAISGKPSPLRGRLDLQGDFDSRTNTLEGLKRHLEGQAALSIDDGAMLDVNVSRQLCMAAAALQGRESNREWREDTAFDRLRASVSVDEGRVHNDDLDIAIPGVSLTGRGDVDLIDRRIDYRADARFTDTADEAVCPVSEPLSRVAFPVRCRGDLGGAPGEWCGIDRELLGKRLASLAGNELRQRAGERVSSALDETLDDDTRNKIDDALGEGASRELGDRIRGLFD
ncbi:AsmA family protein [Salinicola halophilus]|uniref:AsmA family protein n=1 Tax=Salinicola halophilus TaxID=184065 RepID=UPI000DA14F81|nr:AsmA family protein [Salinicola halophilus]